MLLFRDLACGKNHRKNHELFCKGIWTELQTGHILTSVQFTSKMSVFGRCRNTAQYNKVLNSTALHFYFAKCTISTILRLLRVQDKGYMIIWIKTTFQNCSSLRKNVPSFGRLETARRVCCHVFKFLDKLSIYSDLLTEWFGNFDNEIKEIMMGMFGVSRMPETKWSKWTANLSRWKIYITLSKL